MRKEKRSYLQARMKCRIPSTVPHWQVSYVDNPRIREKSHETGEGAEKRASPTEYTAGLLSCVRGEESNLQEPN